MKRLIGKFDGTTTINQWVYQTPPTRFKKIEKLKIPICGGYSEIKSSGEAIHLYCSVTGEVPIYFSLANDCIFWHEQSLAIPGKARLVEKGELITWSKHNGINSYPLTDDLPRPFVKEITVQDAIDQYTQLLLQSVEQRINSLPLDAQNKIAISQSGGLDSFLVTWALSKLGVEVFPITANTDATDWDAKYASQTLAELNLPFYSAHIPVEDLNSLFREAILCCESPQEDNLRMAACNIAIARKAQKLGCKTIFTGHGHDDLHGSSGLTVATFKSLTSGSVWQRWRDARRKAFSGIGMDKMFSSTYRRYGIHVRTPFYDNTLVRFALSLPLTIAPAQAGKPFAIAVTRHLMPGVGLWGGEKYIRRGFGVGAGFYRNQRIQEAIEASLAAAAEGLKFFKKEYAWEWFARYHGSPDSVDSF